jgi:hypothetical protein
MASLDTKQQALILGHAVTMPIVVQTREYNEDFYRSVSLVSGADVQKLMKELF